MCVSVMFVVVESKSARRVDGEFNEDIWNHFWGLVCDLCCYIVMIVYVENNI